MRSSSMSRWAEYLTDRNKSLLFLISRVGLGKAFYWSSTSTTVSVLGSTGHRRSNWRLGEVAGFRPPAGLLEDFIPPDLLLDWKRLKDGLPRRPLD